MTGRSLLVAGVTAGLSLALGSRGNDSRGRPGSGQAPGRGQKPYSPPRLPDGHPDLQGTYDLATLTPLERPAGAKAVLTAEEAAELERHGGRARAKPGRSRAAAIAPRRPRAATAARARPATSAATTRSGSIRARPTRSSTANAARRSIVDPPDGKVPALTAAARQRAAASWRGRPSDATQSDDPGLETAPGAYDDPERRPLGERCLLGFGSTSGPPALPNYFYNNLHQIVQTPNAVMILNEMVHDARIVRMNQPHLPKTVRKWMGDSVGRWEGDTLVVDTTNFTDKTRFRGSSQNLHVVERFTRVDDRTLLYRFTIEDLTRGSGRGRASTRGRPPTS